MLKNKPEQDSKRYYLRVSDRVLKIKGSYAIAALPASTLQKLL
ncbi:hypothetical protein [Gloeocapsopsis crepidinum]|nr:hypothetical protein [Gloeocapsopsis crepidinum]